MSSGLVLNLVELSMGGFINYWFVGGGSTLTEQYA